MTDATTPAPSVGETHYLTCPSCFTTTVVLNSPVPQVITCGSCESRWRLTRTRLGILWESIGAVLPHPGEVS